MMYKYTCYMCLLLLCGMYMACMYICLLYAVTEVSNACTDFIYKCVYFLYICLYKHVILWQPETAEFRPFKYVSS